MDFGRKQSRASSGVFHHLSAISKPTQGAESSLKIVVQSVVE